MSELSAASLLRRPVRLRGVRLGETVDLILDWEGTRVLGFDVLCGDDVHRFLPFAAAQLEGGAVVVDSTLTLLEGDQRAFYRRSGRSLVAERDWHDAQVTATGDLLAA
jgi:hypothetical protein